MIIIKYGGSIINPDGNYSEEAVKELIRLLKKHDKEEFCFIIGGGKICRKLQDASLSLLEQALPKEQIDFARDEIGIAATKINAHYVMHRLKEAFPGEVNDELIIDLMSKPKSGSRIYIGAGVRPGHSTDYDMIVLAELFDAEKAIKISDFPIVLNVKPNEFDKEKIDSYEKLPEMNWEEMHSLVGGRWHAGANYPLDPHACIIGVNLSHEKKGFTLLIGQYSQLEKMIAGEEFVGTKVE